MKIADNFHKETEKHGKSTTAMKTKGTKIANMFKHYKKKKKTITKTPKKKKKYLKVLSTSGSLCFRFEA